MKNSRLLGFCIAILIGLAAGLIYGWLLRPAEPKNVALNSLRSDFQADYVLMVAEAYKVDQNLDNAVDFLNNISNDNPQRAVQEALLVGQQMNYSEQEMRALAALEAVLTTEPAVETQVEP